MSHILGQRLFLKLNKRVTDQKYGRQANNKGARGGALSILDDEKVKRESAKLMVQRIALYKLVKRID